MAVVPITREHLARFYDKHPIDPLPVEVLELHGRIKSLNQRIADSRGQPTPEVGWPFPYKLDDCHWRNRQLCEEAVEALVQVLKDVDEDEVAKACMAVFDELKGAAETVARQQQHNSDEISKQIGAFMPRDFRTALVRRKAAKADRRREKAVNKLLKGGCTVAQKYDLLLEHQGQRRKALANLGACKGVFRWLVKRVVGVPVVLLDFAKQINDKLGPMEEQRARYGPDIYDITRLGLQVRLLAGQWAQDYDGCFEHQDELLACLQEGTSVYVREITRVLGFLGVLFMQSPWFVSPEEIEKARAEMEKRGGGDAAEGALDDDDGLEDEGLEDEEDDLGDEDKATEPKGLAA
eukprot:evm.model.scf_1839.1 EVM.evm.TU.scf_1839.1   scf_1839:654-1703(+)